MTSSATDRLDRSRQQCLAGAVQPDPGGHLPDVERRGRFRDGETVNRHEFKHGPFALRKSLQRLVQLPDLPQGVDPLRQAIDVVGVEQAAARDQALGALLARGPAELGGDDVARDPVQPRPRAAMDPRYRAAASITARNTSAVRSATSCGSATRRATNLVTSSTCAR